MFFIASNYFGGDNILINNQKIQIFWSNKIKKYYLSKGYSYTGINEPFMVDVNDLFPGCKRRVIMKCDNCGNEFDGHYNKYYKRKLNNQGDFCRSCRALNSHGKTKPERAFRKFEKIRDICSENGYILVTKEEDYVDAKMQIEFICPKHGLQKMLMDNIINGHKCYFCSYEERGLNYRNSPDYVESVINSINGNILLNKDDYISSKVRNLRVKCGKCGKNEFLVSFSGYYNVGVNQCRSCSSKESVGEKIIADYLTAHNIEFEREKHFSDCIDKKTLPFDFYVPKYNLIIEFDGQHHFWNVWGQEHFDITQRHDKIKNDYCSKNNINLLRIPYFRGNMVDEIISNKIKEIS